MSFNSVALLPLDRTAAIIRDRCSIENVSAMHFGQSVLLHSSKTRLTRVDSPLYFNVFELNAISVEKLL
jgi:hypothetical protein